MPGQPGQHAAPGDRDDPAREIRIVVAAGEALHRAESPQEFDPAGLIGG